MTVIIMVGFSQWRDGEIVTTQRSRRGTVFTFGCIDNVLRQEAMIGFGVEIVEGGGHATIVS